MDVTLWGTRGSIPTPGPDTVKFGGNTACISIASSSGDILILDAGSGIRPLGLRLARTFPLSVTILLSHTHWDHIQGLPFFVPLFIKGNQIRIMGPADPVSMKGIGEVLSVQMEYRYFPVRSAELKADVAYQALRELEVLESGPFEIVPLLMNHPVMCLGYRIRCDGKTLFYTGDHELPQNIYEEGDDYFDEFELLIEQRKKGLEDFIRGVDLLIADAQYTAAEYPLRKGWGHSTHDQILNEAQKAQVKRLVLTHHEPTRSDAQLEAIFQELKDRWDGSGLPFEFAREGMTISL